MTLLLNKQTTALALTFSLVSISFAQQVVTTTVGSPAKFEIESKVTNIQIKECSIIVTQPNGSTEVQILKAPNFKTSLTYIPSLPGTTVVSWNGVYTLNGKVDNLITGSVKQIFGNIGQILTLSELSQGTLACPGDGTITIVTTASVQQAAATVDSPVIAPTSTLVQPSATSRFRSTANIPTFMNPPIENSDFKAKYDNDNTYRAMVDDFNINRSKQSLTSLKLYSELGDAVAQFLYGLAHLEDWTGLYDVKRACYWIRESAVKGLSQARLLLANKALKEKECFDIPPTLDEANTWAQLASMSRDQTVKENAEKLLQDILRIQISKQR
jgi:hypothetical protein